MNELFSQQIFSVLESLAVKMGEASVRRACQQFLRKKTIAGVKPTKRQRIPRAWVVEAADRQMGICRRCRELLVDSNHFSRDVVGDHIVPIAKGGHHNRWNIAALHRSCNASKGANDLIKESKLGHGTVKEQLS